MYAKCRVLDNIFYDWDNKVQIGAGDHQVNQKIIDNRKMAHTATSTIEISETNTKSISESYTFGSSSTSQIGASLEISKGVTVGDPETSGASSSVTAASSVLQTFESHWDRSQSKSFSTEHSTTVAWEIRCPPRCYCVRRILIGKILIFCVFF